MNAQWRQSFPSQGLRCRSDTARGLQETLSQQKLNIVKGPTRLHRAKAIQLPPLQSLQGRFDPLLETESLPIQGTNSLLILLISSVGFTTSSYIGRLSDTIRSKSLRNETGERGCLLCYIFRERDKLLDGRSSTILYLLRSIKMECLS